MVSGVLLLLAAALIYFAWDLNRLSKETSTQTGVRGSILYSDADHGRPVETLVSDLGEGVRLAGKPDYILRQDGKIFPLEYKSGRSPKTLYDGYATQVGAYFLLIESKYGPAAAPPHGLVRFSDGGEFKVPNTPDLRERVRNIAFRMAAVMRGRAEGHRDHTNPWMCAACKFFPVCEERLEKPDRRETRGEPA